MTEEQKVAILSALMEGKTLKSACEGGPSRATVFRELAADEAFAQRYAEARQVQADVLADEIVDLADNAEANPERGSDLPARTKLQIDARRWYASKLKPKVYGDRFVAEVTQEMDTAAALTAAAARIKAHDEG